MRESIGVGNIPQKFLALALPAILVLAVLACSDGGNSPTEPADPMGSAAGGTAAGGRVGAAPDDAIIDIEKFTNGEDADLPPGPILEVGTPVEWTYLVTNTSGFNLVNIAVTDDQGVTVTCPQTTLPAGADMTCTGDGTAEPVQYENLGLVEGFDDSGGRFTDADPSHYLGADPDIEIEKLTNGEDADLPPGPQILVGDPVQWRYVVTNTGNVTLTNVTVTDDQGVVVNCSQTDLSAGDSMTCTGDGTAMLGQYENLGTATGTSPFGEDVTDTDPSHYLGVESLEGEGCGLGYWKNHLESWPPTSYSPDQWVETVFPSAGLFNLGQNTLLEALMFGGGSGAEGGARILLRHAVAALLNAAHPNVSYPRSDAEVIAVVDAALASQDRSTMLSLKDDLEADNEGSCSLD